MLSLTLPNQITHLPPTHSSSVPAHRRQEAYYAEWERLTLVPEEELNRPMTVATFSKFVPTWLRYNALQGPVRYWLFKDKLADESSSGGDKE